MSNRRDFIAHQIDNIMLDMASGVQPHPESGQTPAFRVSSFPYCPIRSLLFTDRNDSFSMGFYTGMGTAVHNACQKWIVRGGFKRKVFACWKCLDCNTTTKPMHHPGHCLSCGSLRELEYEEITIAYKGLSGHVDMVVEFSPGKFTVIDWKTTDLTGKKQKPNWESYFPASRNSITQISTYSTLLKELFGLNIEAWCLIYVDRAKAITKADDFYKVLRPWNKVRHDDMKYWIDMACTNNKLLKNLTSLLEEEDGEGARKALNKVILNRPCQNEDEYLEYMDYRFYKGPVKNPDQGVVKGDCALKRHCLKGHKSCLKAVQELL